MSKRLGDRPGTLDLVGDGRQGNRKAVEALAARIFELLRRFGHGRLPSDIQDQSTDDLAQDVAVRVLDRLLDPERDVPDRPRALLWAAFLNEVRDRIRAARRRPAVPLEDDPERGPAGHHPEPEYLERIGDEAALARMREGIASLGGRDRRLIELHLEERTFAEIAEGLGLPSADAARMAYKRAFLRLRRDVLAGRRGAT